VYKKTEEFGYPSEFFKTDFFPHNLRYLTLTDIQLKPTGKSVFAANSILQAAYRRETGEGRQQTTDNREAGGENHGRAAALKSYAFYVTFAL
jgi:hypothetical protein